MSQCGNRSTRARFKRRSWPALWEMTNVYVDVDWSSEWTDWEALMDALFEPPLPEYFPGVAGGQMGNVSIAFGGPANTVRRKGWSSDTYVNWLKSRVPTIAITRIEVERYS